MKNERTPRQLSDAEFVVGTPCAYAERDLTDEIVAAIILFACLCAATIGYLDIFQ